MQFLLRQRQRWTCLSIEFCCGVDLKSDCGTEVFTSQTKEQGIRKVQGGHLFHRPVLNRAML
jgi:hypothetical protein